MLILTIKYIKRNYAFRFTSKIFVVNQIIISDMFDIVIKPQRMYERED
jgi:hypothetical protein